MPDFPRGYRLREGEAAGEGVRRIAHGRIDAGLERSYRRGRDGFRSLGDEPSAFALHEWRKRVKDLWYQLRLLPPVWPAVLKGPGAAAAELADLSDALRRSRRGLLGCLARGRLE